MGRTNDKEQAMCRGKLIPFLMKYLYMEYFINLKFEDDQKIVFYVILPRFMKDKYEEYEDILKEWYKCNGKLHKYENYSKGKSVFQAALKKSIYLVKEKKVGKRLRYRFATEDEIAENRRKLKEKEHLKENPESPVSTTSSGYHSGSEEENVHQDGAPFDFFDDLLNHPENYLSDYPIDENLFPDIEMGIDDDVPQNVTSNDSGQIFQPVTELTAIPVAATVNMKKYWLCTQMIKVKSTLQLICEPQIINEDSGIKEGSVTIPNGVFEPGISYEMKKSFELNDMLHIFFVPNVN